MQQMTWAERLWGVGSRFRYVLLAAVVLLFSGLGGREIWTQEHRWADIVFTMMSHHDYLHPSLDGMDYYDKPLMSYWLIVLTAKIIGQLNVWALRIPSALSGVLAIFAIYRIGDRLRNHSFGMLAAWLLLTTYYFVFWARTSSADMMNVAGALLGVMWYLETKNRPNFFSYVIFYLILVVTALCKGLVGPVVTLLAIFPDLLVQQNWKKHLRFSACIAMIPAAMLYLFPFWASTHYGVTGYQENGLYLVYRENILRYFQPFDHKDPIYTYLIYLPIYLLPWTCFFIPGLLSLKTRWHHMSWNSKWIVWMVGILFLFFTASGSRRSYYVLPIVPFGILLTVDWLMAEGQNTVKRLRFTGKMVISVLFLLLINFAVLQPFYYSQMGYERFANQVHKEAVEIKPWSEWKVILFDPESKVRFYLRLPPELKNYSVEGDRDQQTRASLVQACPLLANKPKDTIFITRMAYVKLLQNDFKNYHMVILPATFMERWLTKGRDDIPVAFIPTH